MNTMTTTDVAEELRCHPQTVARHAARLGLGTNLGGRAGYRFTRADVDALWEAMRPKPVTAQRRRRRAS